MTYDGDSNYYISATLGGFVPQLLVGELEASLLAISLELESLFG